MLKNPSHLFALDALFATYPDALVVQCHRPAETHHGVDVLAGAAHDRGLVERASSVTTIGQDSLETWSRGLELFNAERAKHDPAQFYDSITSTSSPIRSAVVEEIYRHFGIELTDAARDGRWQAMPRREQEGPARARSTPIRLATTA